VGDIDKKKQGRSNKRKGSNVERIIVKLHNECAIKARRVPLSGAVKGYEGDIYIPLTKEDHLIAEVKSRKGGGGFTTLEGWLGDNDILFLKRNNRRPAVYMPWATYERLLEYVKRATTKNI